MNDILTRLPPDTVIAGYVGDGGSYRKFRTTAGTARADIAEVCAAHAANHTDHFERGIVRSPTTPASYWFYDRESETVATHEDYPGLLLYIDTVRSPGQQTDIRTDPWTIRRVEFSAEHDFACWEDPSDAAAEAAAFFRKMGEFLARVTSDVQEPAPTA